MILAAFIFIGTGVMNALACIAMHTMHADIDDDILWYIYARLFNQKPMTANPDFLALLNTVPVTVLYTGATVVGYHTRM
jgi:hypothetical protein